MSIPFVTVPPANAPRRAHLRSVTEAILAVALTAVLGLSFWLFTGEPLGTDSPDVTVPVTNDPAAAARGEILASDTGCLACHTIDGTPSTGPTWKGIAGSSRPLESGETVTADDAYLDLAIVDPLAQIVQGYDPVMPTTYSEQLTGDEISDLVEYIKSLAS